MKTLNLIVCLLVCLITNVVFGQEDSMHFKIFEYMNLEINNFKLQLCPQFKDSVFRDGDFISSGYQFLYPRLDLGYSYDFDIKPWPENESRSYINFFLVIKRNNIMTHSRLATFEEGSEKYIRVKYSENGDPVFVTDTFDVKIPCYDYFPMDERYLIRYDSIKKDFACLSGNLFLDKLAFHYDAGDFANETLISTQAVKLRVTQYATSESIFAYGVNTDEYFEFSVTKTIFPVPKLLVRIPRIKHIWFFGDTWEMIYYSNSSRIPGNFDRSWYEVSYYRTINPKTYEELFPKYRKLKDEEVGIVFRKLLPFSEFEPDPSLR